MAGEDDQLLAGLEEVGDPLLGAVKLAARGNQRQLRDPDQRLGAAGTLFGVAATLADRGGAGVIVQARDLAREGLVGLGLGSDPLGDVGLGGAVLAAVGDRDRDDDALLGRKVAQDVGLAAADEARPAQAAVERGELLAARVGAGDASRAADGVEAAEDLQLRGELLGAVEDGRAGEQQDDRILGQRGGDRGDGLRASCRRVLAEVRLVEDERPGRGGDGAVDQGVGDLVAGHGDVVRARGVAAGESCARAMRQPALGLAQPVDAQRRGRDDERRVGVGGFERRERLDRLAQAGFVGEERAPGAQRVVDGRAPETGAAARSGRRQLCGPPRRWRAPPARRRCPPGRRPRRARGGCRDRPGARGGLPAARVARRRHGSRPTMSRRCA